jgi:hypothetical protein
MTAKKCHNIKKCELLLESNFRAPIARREKRITEEEEICCAFYDNNVKLLVSFSVLVAC